MSLAPPIALHRRELLGRFDVLAGAADLAARDARCFGLARIGTWFWFRAAPTRNYGYVAHSFLNLPHSLLAPLEVVEIRTRDVLDLPLEAQTQRPGRRRRWGDSGFGDAV